MNVTTPKTLESTSPLSPIPIRTVYFRSTTKIHSVFLFLICLAQSLISWIKRSIDFRVRRIQMCIVTDVSINNISNASNTNRPYLNIKYVLIFDACRRFGYPIRTAATRSSDCRQWNYCLFMLLSPLWIACCDYCLLSSCVMFCLLFDWIAFCWRVCRQFSPQLLLYASQSMTSIFRHPTTEKKKWWKWFHVTDNRMSFIEGSDSTIRRRCTGGIPEIDISLCLISPDFFFCKIFFWVFLYSATWFITDEWRLSHLSHANQLLIYSFVDSSEFYFELSFRKTWNFTTSFRCRKCWDFFDDVVGGIITQTGNIPSIFFVFLCANKCVHWIGIIRLGVNSMSIHSHHFDGLSKSHFHLRRRHLRHSFLFCQQLYEHRHRFWGDQNEKTQKEQSVSHLQQDFRSTEFTWDRNAHIWNRTNFHKLIMFDAIFRRFTSLTSRVNEFHWDDICPIDLTSLWLLVRRGHRIRCVTCSRVLLKIKFMRNENSDFIRFSFRTKMAHLGNKCFKIYQLLLKDNFPFSSRSVFGRRNAYHRQWVEYEFVDCFSFQNEIIQNSIERAPHTRYIKHRKLEFRNSFLLLLFFSVKIHCFSFSFDSNVLVFRIHT